MLSINEVLEILNSDPGGVKYTREEAVSLNSLLNEFAEIAFEDHNRKERNAGSKSIRETGDFI